MLDSVRWFALKTFCALVLAGLAAPRHIRAQEVRKASLQQGVILDSVQCKADQDQYYAVYIPKELDVNEPVDIVILFDPAARGKLPITLYKELADKYGMVLSCPNNSKNGPYNVGLDAFQATFKDLSGIYGLRFRRKIASGFSGGGRLAHLVSFRSPTFNGSISNAGPKSMLDIAPANKKDFLYVGLVGLRDMNYAEHRLFSKKLDSMGVANVLISYVADHQWAPKEQFEKAIQWSRAYESQSEGNNSFLQAQILQARSMMDTDPLQGIHLMSSLGKYFDVRNTTGPDGLEDQQAKLLRQQMKELNDELREQRDYSKGFVDFKMYVDHPKFEADSSDYNLDFWKTTIQRYQKRLRKDSSDHYAARQLSYITGQVFAWNKKFMSSNNLPWKLSLNSIGSFLYPNSVSLKWVRALLYARMGKKSKMKRILKQLGPEHSKTLQQVRKMNEQYRTEFPELWD